jgi:hypothetical protein
MDSELALRAPWNDDSKSQALQASHLERVADVAVHSERDDTTH